MNFFQDMLASIGERGRALIEGSPRRLGGLTRNRAALADLPAYLADLCERLLSGRGEASGVALAKEILNLYAMLDREQAAAFFRLIAKRFGPDPERLREAWRGYEATPSPETLRALVQAAEPPRQELFRRLNLAQNGTSRLVRLRADLLAACADDRELLVVDDDLSHLLRSWFNRGFLVLRRITWSTPADVLERIIQYEAVHAIDSWSGLQQRLAPQDRRCYAFFHPSLVDDPLIFVEVALTRDAPASVDEILSDEREVIAEEEATTAVFYSISNCQDGLRGISFGSFLIKQVVEELSRDLPRLKKFVTLSPAPGFGRWLRQQKLDEARATTLALLDAPHWQDDDETVERLRPILLGSAADYYLNAKTAEGKPLDAVARFHLGNGARLDRLNWPADTSEKGISEGAGLMVNYLYDPDSIEANHEAFANNNTVVASPAIARHMRDFGSRRAAEARHV